MSTGAWGYRPGRRRAADFIALLDQVLQAFPLAPVIAMICDNDSIHHARKVIAYLGKHPRLELLYGARYSPHDNPVSPGTVPGTVPSSAAYSGCARSCPASSRLRLLHRGEDTVTCAFIPAVGQAGHLVRVIPQHRKYRFPRRGQVMDIPRQLVRDPHRQAVRVAHALDVPAEVLLLPGVAQVDFLKANISVYLARANSSRETVNE